MVNDHNATRTIEVSGFGPDAAGYNRIFIDVKRNGRVFDAWREESRALTTDELWVRFGRRIVREFSAMYGISSVSKPTYWKFRGGDGTRAASRKRRASL